MYFSYQLTKFTYNFKKIKSNKVELFYEKTFVLQLLNFQYVSIRAITPQQYKFQNEKLLRLLLMFCSRKEYKKINENFFMRRPTVVSAVMHEENLSLWFSKFYFIRTYWYFAYITLIYKWSPLTLKSSLKFQFKFFSELIKA
jgi:hypothetical protein